jgi:hypothetical protein
MKYEFGEGTRRFNLCFLFSDSADGKSKSSSRKPIVISRVLLGETVFASKKIRLVGLQSVDNDEPKDNLL